LQPTEWRGSSDDEDPASPRQRTFGYREVVSARRVFIGWGQRHASEAPARSKANDHVSLVGYQHHRHEVTSTHARWRVRCQTAKPASSMCPGNEIHPDERHGLGGVPITSRWPEPDAALPGDPGEGQEERA
jgi:hypothetical protein